MVAAGVMKIIGAGLEFILALPGFGGALIISLFWLPLLFMLVYHIITLVKSKNLNLPVWGPVVGIVASTVGVIPIVGFMLHWAAFICLLIDGILTVSKKNKQSNTGNTAA